MTLERLFRRRGPKKAQNEDLPDLWSKCPSCNTQIYNKDLEANLRVCPNCGHHHRLPVHKRAEALSDPGTFEVISGQIKPLDPLEFVDSEPYPTRVAKYREKTGRDNAILAGRATLGGIPIVLTIMDFEFAAGSLGSAEGEEIARSAEIAASEDRPLIIVTASGGARMQESALSLMQLAKTTVALEELAKKNLPYISILTDPTTGGVTASFATIADVIIAEPKALIGFAGQRIIQQTIRQNLPEGFQRSELLENKGFIDIILDRRQHASTIARLLAMLTRRPLPQMPSRPTPEPSAPPKKRWPF